MSDPAAESELRFDKVISSAQVHRRPGSSEGGEAYDPVEVTSEYVQYAMRLEEAWTTTLATARERLAKVDPRELYFEFLCDLARRIETGGPSTERLAALVEQVAIRGLGMSYDHVRILRPTRGGTRWSIRFDEAAVKSHLQSHIVGRYFLNPISIESALRDRLTIGGSDVSQHTSAVPVPAKYFRRTVPFVLNNAAGALLEIEGGQARYQNIFNPKPDESLLRWMLIDPSYQDELEPEDYRRCLASAMDVGQYRFDLEYLMKGDRRPNVIYRDGSLFPQDAYVDNFIVDNRRAEFTREAIREMLDCLLYASSLDILYCGVSKQVQLRVYSAVVDWFIATQIDGSWEFGNYVANDGQAMSVLLASPSFNASALEEAVSTCLIRRSFTTRANLNTRAPHGDLDAFFAEIERRQSQQRTRFDLTPFRKLCELAHFYMFFVGHSRSPSEQLPRYEFFLPPDSRSADDAAALLLTGLSQSGFTIDNDHSFMSKDPVRYLMPTVTQQAHTISKDVGRHIDTLTGQWIMARFMRGIRNA